jgi:hypothetical protein
MKRLRITLITIFVVILGFCGTKIWEARQKQQAINAIRESGGFVILSGPERERWGDFSLQPVGLAECLFQDVNGVLIYDLTFMGQPLSDIDEIAEYLPQLQSIEFVEIELDDLEGLGTDRTARCLAKLSNLRRVNLVGTSIGPPGLAAMANCENIESLTISGASVADESLQALKGWKKLKELNLIRSKTLITEYGIKALSSHTLDVLSLNRVPLSPLALEAFGELQMRHLGLYYCADDESFVSFAPPSGLRSLSLGTRISETVAQQVHNRNPTYEVEAQSKTSSDTRYHLLPRNGQQH